MKTYTITVWPMSKYFKNQRGMSFLWLIGVLLAVSAIGAAMAYIVVGSTYNASYGAYHLKALYVAEAGGNYAVPLLASAINTGNSATLTSTIATLNGQTFPLGSNSFSLSVDNSQNAYLSLKSTGSVNKTSVFPAQRLITFRLNKSITDNFNTTSAPTTVNANNWTAPNGNIVSSVGGLSNVLQLGASGGTQSAAGMNWNGSGSTMPSLLSQWYISGKLLSYELQCKVDVDSSAQDYMAGLSFRLGEDKHTAGDGSFDTTYGVSFYRRDCTVGVNCPAWITAVNSDSNWLALNNDATAKDYVYLVLWKEIQGAYTLLAYKKLTVADGIVSNITGGTTLNPWSTILVTVLEQFNGSNRENHIYVYTASSTMPVLPYAVIPYPGGTVNWTYYFVGTLWTNKYAGSSGTWSAYNYNLTASPPYIIDTSAALTTANFDINVPTEIGLHSYYDTAATYPYFTDFAMRFPGGATQNVIAYY
ncbi:MAG: hypothetical protein HQK98_03425 [Nitrospirae bacterium]|nr:hypothetical protein [Nitrospirota bacterium]